MMMNLYYVKDKIQDCVISPMIPVSSDLAAAVGFAKAYIKEKDPVKNPYNYRELELIRFASIQEDVDKFTVKNQEVHVLDGEAVFKYVNECMQARGIDDYFIDDNKGE